MTRHTESQHSRYEKTLNLRELDDRVHTMLRSDLDYADILNRETIVKIRGLVFDELYECMQDEGSLGTIKVLATLQRHGRRTDKGHRRSG